MTKGIGRVDAILISMLTGWWCYALGAWISPGWLASLVNFPAWMLLMQRGVLYFRGYASPISLGGRIATFRWIIPGYDRAALFVPLAILAFPTIMMLSLYLGIPRSEATPILAAALILITLTTPPKLKRWRLTGQHRLVPAISKVSEEYVQVG